MNNKTPYRSLWLPPPTPAPRAAPTATAPRSAAVAPSPTGDPPGSTSSHATLPPTAAINPYRSTKFQIEPPQFPSTQAPMPTAGRPHLKSIVVGSLTLEVAPEETAPQFQLPQPKRVRFSSHLLPANRRSSTNGAPPTKSCLRSAPAAPVAGLLGRSSTGDRPGHSFRPSAIPSREGYKLDGANPAPPAPAAHSCGPAPAPRESEEGEWTPVRRKHWWRSPEFMSSAPSSPASTRVDSVHSDASEKLREHMRGKCYRCLARGHDAFACRDPVRCLLCHCWGHKARHCKKPQKRKAPSSDSAPASSTALSAQLPSPHSAEDGEARGPR